MLLPLTVVSVAATMSRLGGTQQKLGGLKTSGQACCLNGPSNGRRSYLE